MSKTIKYILLATIIGLLFFIVKNTTMKINVDITFKSNLEDISVTPKDTTSKDDTLKTSVVDSVNLYNIEYVQNSEILPIEDDMVLSDKEEFDDYSNGYKKLISQKFSVKQTKAIKEIIVSDSYSFDSGDGDNSAGLCSTISIGGNTKSYILIASKNNNHNYNLLHECCHALYFDNISLFNKKYRDRWMKLNNQYVTDYASTDIDEDFAETGACYLTGLYPKNCKDKIKLFEEFYLNTK